MVRIYNCELDIIGEEKLCLLIYFASDIYRLSLSNDFSSLRLKEYDIILTDV